MGNYYALAKPGIIFGNIITALGGFALATRGTGGASGTPIDFPLLGAMLIGLSLVIASGSVFNNYFERRTDALMERTKDRALVVGRISPRAALAYAATLGALGFFILTVYVNIIAAAVALVGFFFYVVMYTLLFKHRSSWGTLIGAVAGAVPPVVGYAAAANQLDAAAIILFAILALWQMPHFYAIGIYRRDEYAAAAIPILPVTAGLRATKIVMLIYIAAFAAAAATLSNYAAVGNVYRAVVIVLSAAWLALSLRGFWARDDRRWARTMFFLSLVILIVLFATIALDAA